jgi:hypothetical protein
VLFPNAIHVFGTSGNFAVSFVGQHGVDNALVECKLTPVVRYLEHIVIFGIDSAASYRFGTFSQFGDHLFLPLARF